MAATPLTGSPAPIPLGEGYTLRAPGLRGTAELKRPVPGAATRGGQDATSALAEAFDRTDVETVRDIELQVRPAPGVAQTRLRSATGGDAVELQVPDLGAKTGQLVLSCDESGVLTWHLPQPETAETAVSPTRGGGKVKRFVIPATALPPDDGPSRSRSLVSAVGRKLLKVLVYPLTDPVIGPVGEFFAGKWEEKNRPYGVRDFTPETASSPNGRALTAEDWAALGQGPALLFIHGTFSTAHGAFAQLPKDALQSLHQKYAGRVFAFNHFTLSHDPAENVARLLALIPASRRLEVDIVCHSRGGLVARTLAERPSAFGVDASRIAVRRVVFAGVPNQGTLLAHPDHMVKMIDRMTTALNLFPTGPVSETLEVLVTAVKVIGHGALKGLNGLASMHPDGPFLRTLNQGQAGKVDYYGIAANFEPAHAGLKALVAGSADAVLDCVFEDAENDLVVPEAGVYGANGGAGFPLDGGRVLRVPQSAAISHTTIFGYPLVSAKIQEWLGA